MVRIDLTRTPRLEMRAAMSPLTNLVVGLVHLLKDPGRVARQRGLRTWEGSLSGVDLSPLAPLGALDLYPDFMLPLPDRERREFTDELARMRTTGEAGVRDDLAVAYGDEVPTAMRPFAERPAVALEAFCDALEAAWERAVAPLWPEMLELLEQQIVVVGRTLALQGSSGVLGHIHPRIRLTSEALELDVPHEETVPLGDRSVLLIPLATGEWRLTWNTYPDDRVIIAYEVPGTQRLWQPAAVSPEPRLAMLLGEPRARVLVNLRTPITTKDLGTLLGMPPQSAAWHLGRLTRSGVVARARVKRRVYYGLTADGERLLSMLDDSRQRSAGAGDGRRSVPGRGRAAN